MGLGGDSEKVEALSAEVTRLKGLLDPKTSGAALQRIEELEARLGDLERSSRLQGALADAAHAFVSAPATREALFDAVGSALEASDQLCVIYDVELESRELVLRQLRLRGDGVEAAENLLGFSPIGYRVSFEGIAEFHRCIDDGEAAIVHNLVAEIDQMLPAGQRGLADSLGAIVGMKQAIYAPLVADGEVAMLLGVLSDRFTAADVEAVAGFAQLLTAAARRVRLVEDLERSVRQLRETQSQLVQAQKMQAVGQLVGGISHDFNNLLTAIAGSAEMLVPQVTHDARATESVELIRAAAARAGGLVRQLLSFSRPGRVGARAVDINELVRGLSRLLPRVVGEHYDITTELAEGPCTVVVDGSQLEQVLINFVVNARDAMPDGGHITLSTSVESREQDGRNMLYVRVAVSDDGVGMDEATREHIFEPFFTTKAVGKGTGLGLSVAHGVVNEHGGHLRVDSEPGRGTTIAAYIPASDEKPERRTIDNVAAMPATGGGARVLLVEDEAAIVRLVRRVLESRGYEVVDTRTIGDATDVLSSGKHEIDIVLSDVRLPDGSGVDLVEAFREKRPDLIFVLSSGYVDSMAQESRIEEMGVPFLRKPYTMGQLLTTLERMLSEKAGA